jgi:hypothetical protein
VQNNQASFQACIGFFNLLSCKTTVRIYEAKLKINQQIKYLVWGTTYIDRNKKREVSTKRQEKELHFKKL